MTRDEREPDTRDTTDSAASGTRRPSPARTSVGPRRSAAGTRLLWAAAAAGLVHAGFSLYWAVGGRWLLDTVGQWAVDLGHDRPAVAGVTLVAIAALKTAAAVIPALATAGRIRPPRLWRGLAWPAAVVLTAYGAATTLTANLVLTGTLRSDGGYDHTAMLGHAYLWDPLFLLWGVLLAAGLFATRVSANREAR